VRARVSARLTVARDDSRGGVPLAPAIGECGIDSYIHMFDRFFDLSRGRPPPLRPFNDVVASGFRAWDEAVSERDGHGQRHRLSARLAAQKMGAATALLWRRLAVSYSAATHGVEFASHSAAPALKSLRPPAP
jgi:hypothetical protein